ncbi:hypothetical protein ACS0TY_024664 [Phlomoides rotata]
MNLIRSQRNSTTMMSVEYAELVEKRISFTTASVDDATRIHLRMHTRRRTLDKQGPTVVHQKPGPLQTIFNFLPVADVNDTIYQVVEHSYSCALERSFLYHGRMYVSAWLICLHSNVFSKQMKVSFTSLGV